MSGTTDHVKRVKEELKKVGVTGYGLSKGETRKLPSVIHEDEHIGGAVYGHSGDISAMLVATDKRIIFLDSKPMFSTMDELSYDVVSGVKVNRAIPFSSVTLHTRVGDYILRFVNSKCANIFAKFIEQKRIGSDGYQTTKANKEKPENIEAKQTKNQSSLDANSQAFLDSHDLGVLSTIDRTGMVHGSTVNYMLLNDAIFILTKSDTQKSRNLHTNSQVALTIYDKDKLQTLQLQGIANIEVDQNTKNQVFEEMIKPKKYGDSLQLPPVAKLNAGAFVVVRINPTVAKYSEFKS